MGYSMTLHAEKRANQRGFRKIDFRLILEAAEQVAPDAFLMTHDAAQREIKRRKEEIQQLEKLRGKKLVVVGDTVVTAYHAGPSEQKRILRKGREYA